MAVNARQIHHRQKINILDMFYQLMALIGLGETVVIWISFDSLGVYSSRFLSNSTIYTISPSLDEAQPLIG